jgi:hypothetical protein
VPGGITGLPGRWESLKFESPSARGYNWATQFLGIGRVSKWRVLVPEGITGLLGRWESLKFES